MDEDFTSPYHGDPETGEFFRRLTHGRRRYRRRFHRVPEWTKQGSAQAPAHSDGGTLASR